VLRGRGQRDGSSSVRVWRLQEMLAYHHHVPLWWWGGGTGVENLKRVALLGSRLIPVEFDPFL